MSVSTLNGRWMFGPQSAKGAVATTFYELRTLSTRGGVNDITEPMPPELGAVPITDGAHRLATFYAAPIDLIPRLEEDGGWLLYAACGNVSTVSDVPEAGLYTHYFRMDPSDYSSLKWITARRETPSEGSAASMGTQALDTRVSQILFNFAAASRLTARVGFLGRQPSFSDDISGWTYESAEDSTSIAVTSSADSEFKITDFQAGDLPTPQVRVTLGNQVSTPQQEFIVGSPYPDDLIGLYRNVVFEAAYKWEDEDLYLQLCANAGTGATIAWVNNVFEGNASVKAVSPANISGKNYPYSLEITAPKVIWFPSSPPEMAGLNLVLLPMTGIVSRPTSGDAFQVKLINEIAGYTWPT